ncbi:MAG: VWA domain-containing protein [Polyangiales bacterium]
MSGPGDDAKQNALTRWRLVLGEAANESMPNALGATDLRRDEALGWLYERGEGEGTEDGRDGGTGDSVLSVPDWLTAIHELFPRNTIERLEKDAVEVYGIDEVVTNPEVLARVVPSEALLAAVLKTKHLMNPELLKLARELVKKVVEKLVEALQVEIRKALSGTLDRRQHSPMRIARNLDFRRTLHQNLRHYDAETKKLIVENPSFYSRTKRHSDKWQVILLVDQSGSMTESVIHSAVTASCLYGIPGVKTHLCIFDTAVVDLTDQVTDPVETLMKVQLGGGTDIAKAVQYGAQLVEAPARTIFVIISDFYEGGSEWQLIESVKGLVESGVHVLALGALCPNAFPAWNRETAGRLEKVGAHAGAMTPGELAGFIAQKVRG